MAHKVFVLSLGCPRNLVDSEVLIGNLKKHGFAVADEPSGADSLIVNTCAFIEKAKEESVESILKLAELKTAGKNKDKKLIVTGCLAQRYSHELKKEIGDIDGIFGCSDFIKIAAFLSGPPLPANKAFVKVTRVPAFLYTKKDGRELLTPKHFAYVKIQEGCVNMCSYCVIPKIRGPYRSRPFDAIIEEVKSLKVKGVKEINIIGQDTTLYGIDRYGKPRIAELVEKISDIMSGRWVRLLYAHPAHVDDKLIDVLGSAKNVVKYIDLPIQHINDRMLALMNRKVTRKEIETLIKKIRSRVPDAGIRTSLIIGFPGEGKKEFRELVDFVKDMNFERLGAFIYSREEGTAAYSMKCHVSGKEKISRFEEMLLTQQAISEENNRALLERTIRVMIDEKLENEKDCYLARTEMDAPDVDGLCYVKTGRKLVPGDFVDVKITDTMEYDLVGVPV